MDLTAEESKQVLDEHEDMVVIDVRTPPEFAQGRIKGAILIDMMQPDFEQNISEYSRDDKYFIYCRSGSRSARIVYVMEQLGFEQIFHLAHGLMDWTDSGYELVH